jgi:hypothetical protein
MARDSRRNNDQQAPKGQPKPRGHHHVPLMLQGAWAKPAKGKLPQVDVFDKHDSRSFRTSGENIMLSRDFNSFDNGEMALSLEGGMGQVEYQASKVIKRLRAQRSLADLAAEDRAALCVFTALQRLRGLGIRAQMLDVDAQIRARLRESGDDPDTIPQLVGGRDPEQIKLTALMLIRNNLDVFAKSLALKAMFLFQPPQGRTLLLGDSPVVMSNSTDHGPYGNIGFEVEGIELYLPVAPDLAIGFWCPTLVSMMEAALKQCENSLRNTAAAALFGVGPEVLKLRRMRADLASREQRIRQELAHIGAGTPVRWDSSNLDYVNSLQVAQAERHILSHDGDFALVRRMIADNPALRGGPRSMLQ